MPSPTRRTLTGTCQNPDLTVPAGKAIVIKLLSTLTDLDDNVLVTTEKITQTLDGTGSFSVDLVSDSGDVQPQPVYSVQECFGELRGYRIVIPAGSGSIDLSDLAPVGPSPTPPSAYQLLGDKGQPDGYASLGSDGKVPTAQLPTSGAGSVQTVAGVSPDGAGNVALTAANVGADATGTAAALVDDLSGVTNAPAARTALGLGTASTHPATDFDASGAAAAAQAAAAADATTKANSAQSAATSAAAADASTKANAAQAGAIAASAQRASNLSDLASAATARTNLGLGTVATHAASEFLAALTPTAAKTAAYTANVGDLALMNVASGGTPLTLPTAPADKSIVGYRAIGATTAVPLVVNAGGSDTIGTAGATSASVALADEVTVLQYQASATRWLAVANVKTQASLDARYVAGLAGDGSDGAVTISGSTTLTRDMYYDSLFVAATGTLITAGFRCFVRGACSVASGGAIRCDGAPGLSSGAAGGQYGNTFVPLGRNGAGGAGGSTTGVAGSNNSTGVYSMSALGGAGGAGSSGAGGAAGTQTNPTFWTSAQQTRSGPEAARTGVFFNGNWYLVQGGTGGGGGGGDGGNTGGGGGAGGGVLVLVAGSVSNSGTISANGGNGGTKPIGNVGGGGGGGGGVVLVVTNSYSGNNPTATGGTAGAGVGTGVAGANGAAGTVVKVTP